MYLEEYTLDKESFLAIHNTLCKLQWHKDDAVKDAVENIRKSLKGLYAQEDAAFKTLSDHYNRVKKELRLTTIWSIYEVDNLWDPHPYTGARVVVYKDHWGEDAVSQPIEGTNSWAALWVAADAAIRKSGDGHHCFVEGFRQTGDILYLTTGS
jgi:hypothetical protein